MWLNGKEVFILVRLEVNSTFQSSARTHLKHDPSNTPLWSFLFLDKTVILSLTG